MSPVHVLVSENPADEQAWATAFAGAVDLYRFGRNAEAFERLTSAASPIDLVILTQNQDGPFNLTADQLVARVIDSPIGGVGPLARLYAVVIGEQVRSTNPRVACVSTLEAAIRLIKFGELERTPRPTAPAAPAARPDVDRELAVLGGLDLDFDIDAGDESMFASSVISRIWDAGDQAARDARRRLQQRDPRVEGGGGAAAEARRPEQQQRPAQAQRRQAAAPRQQHEQPMHPPSQEFREHHQTVQVSSSLQLFANEPPHPASLTAARLASPPAPGQQAQPSLAVQQQPIVGGGAAALAHPGHVPGEAVEVGTGIGLLPARPYAVQGAGYRGPGTRGGHVHVASHHAPIPPALAQQVHSMVYPAQGAVADPLLTWSGSGSGNVMTKGVPVPQGGGQPIPMGHAAHAPGAQPQPRVAMPQAPQQPQHPQPVPHQQHRPAAPAMPQQSAAAESDPFLRRAESDSGASFG